MKKYLLAFLFFISSFFALTAQEVPQNSIRIYTESDFSISFDADWQLDTSRIAGSRFFLFSKPESNLDLFRENINLIIQNLSGLKMNMDQYIEVSLNQLEEYIPDCVVETSERSYINGNEIHKLIFTGSQNTSRLKFLQYVYIKEEKAYVLTFTGEQKKFDDYLERATNILNSFKFH
jgi:serine/threonine-protein kinase